MNSSDKGLQSWILFSSMLFLIVQRWRYFSWGHDNFLRLRALEIRFLAELSLKYQAIASPVAGTWALRVLRRSWCSYCLHGNKLYWGWAIWVHWIVSSRGLGGCLRCCYCLQNRHWRQSYKTRSILSSYPAAVGGCHEFEGSNLPKPPITDSHKPQIFQPLTSSQFFEGAVLIHLAA